MSTNKPLPPDVAALLDGILEGIRSFLDKGETIIPTWFIASREMGAMHPVPVPFRNDRQKDIAARAIRELVSMMQQVTPIDCVAFICEGWGLTTQNDERGQRLRETGNIRDEPDAVDIIMINIETYEGVWAAQPQVFQRDDRRELGPIEIRCFEHFEGRMSNWLPPKPGTTRQ